MIYNFSQRTPYSLYLLKIFLCLTINFSYANNKICTNMDPNCLHSITVVTIISGSQIKSLNRNPMDILTIFTKEVKDLKKEYTSPVFIACDELASNPDNVVSLMGMKSYTGCSGSGQYSCDPNACS